MKFRKKPVIIEAIRWTGENFAEIGAWSSEVFGPYSRRDYLKIKTLEGEMFAFKMFG